MMAIAAALVLISSLTLSASFTSAFADPLQGSTRQRIGNFDFEVATDPRSPGAGSPVTVMLTPPAGVAPGTYTTTVRAASTNDPTVFKTVTDVTTIAGAAVPRITGVVAPASVDPGGTTTINYTIENAGNQAGAFDLAFVAPSGWTVTDAVTPSVTLAPNATATTSATLQVPADALAGPYLARLTATASDANGARHRKRSR